MQDSTTPSKKRYNATTIIDTLEFMTGVSQKTNNEYLIGTLYIKSPISDTPIRLNFDYIDPNTRELIKMAIEKNNVSEIDQFKNGVQN